MNMMSLQERREEQAVPDFVRDLRNDHIIEDTNPGNDVAPAASRTTLLERLAWFRNLSLARKINTIFGTFFGVGLLMTLVLGLGLGELWNRYNASARVQEALVAAGKLQSTAGELRYHSVRVLYDTSADLSEQQRTAESAMMTQVAAIETAIAADAPALAPRVAALREELSAFETTFDRAREDVRGGGNANDVVFYTATVSMDRLFPIDAFLPVGDNIQMSLETAVRNQPYASQAAPVVLCADGDDD